MELEKARKPKVVVRTTFDHESTLFSEENAGGDAIDLLSESSRHVSPSSLSNKISQNLLSKLSDVILEKPVVQVAKYLS